MFSKFFDSYIKKSVSFSKTIQLKCNEAVEKERERIKEQKIKSDIIKYSSCSIVVCISNEWHDPTVGVIKDFEISKNGIVLPIVYDIMSGKEFICFGIVKEYSEDFIRVLYKLNPYEQYLLISNSSSKLMTKEKSGKVLYSAEEIISSVNKYIKENKIDSKT